MLSTSKLQATTGESFLEDSLLTVLTEIVRALEAEIRDSHEEKQAIQDLMDINYQSLMSTQENDFTENYSQPRPTFNSFNGFASNAKPFN